MTFFDFPDSVNAHSMSAACKFLFKEGINHTESNTQTYNTLTESKDLRIVMLSGHLCHKLVGAKSASDALIFIANKRNTDSGTADRDSSLSLAARYIFCNLDSGINIRIRVSSVRSAAIKDLKALFLKVLSDLLSQFIACVI